MADSRAKQIRIKTGVVKRLAKEKAMYLKESIKECEKLEKLKASGGDSYVISQQERVMRESEMMIPDTTRRFQVAYKELQEILDNDVELSETDEYQNALSVLRETKEVVSTSS